MCLPQGRAPTLISPASLYENSTLSATSCAQERRGGSAVSRTATSPSPLRSSQSISLQIEKYRGIALQIYGASTSTTASPQQILPQIEKYRGIALQIYGAPTPTTASSRSISSPITTYRGVSLQFSGVPTPTTALPSSFPVKGYEGVTLKFSAATLRPTERTLLPTDRNFAVGRARLRAYTCITRWRLSLPQRGIVCRRGARDALALRRGVRQGARQGRPRRAQLPSPPSGCVGVREAGRQRRRRRRRRRRDAAALAGWRAWLVGRLQPTLLPKISGRVLTLSGCARKTECVVPLPARTDCTPRKRAKWSEKAALNLLKKSNNQNGWPGIKQSKSHKYHYPIPLVFRIKTIKIPGKSR